MEENDGAFRIVPLVRIVVNTMDERIYGANRARNIHEMDLSVMNVNMRVSILNSSQLPDMHSVFAQCTHSHAPLAPNLVSEAPFSRQSGACL